METLKNTSRVIATELRQAERSINMAQRDVAQFLLTTLDATEAHKLSPAISLRTVRATLGALNALADGQGQMAVRAHLSAERAGQDLGLDATAWGSGSPKPALATIEEAVAA
ncbi:MULTISPECIES: hypothetical protein [unclassified Sphingomonas]|uniref:hypothetical protein n=1 Tax=unclassified Sphingomonas TaxID=196159 RepID=UPI0009261B6D|nr:MULTISPECIES: hypothetical protein [unclassified Sphingomonas]MBN8846980.1 hypothetical protein [Sphingomonas sp.]OJV27512.1 MAG: hypothetical protein BGO24_00825 [Sphingomonas sp. 67-36]